MPKVTLKEILINAYNNHYAVGAFNVVDSTFMEAVVSSAEECNSPVILNIAEVHFPFFDLESTSAMVLKRIEKSEVPITLNLDHGLTLSNIHRALDYGFSSIMFDGSHLDLRENIKNTQAIVELCRSYDVSVEAELGAVGGSEGGELIGEVDAKKYTDIDEAKLFLDETDIDALAVAIGNSHGKYKGKPNLDFERLANINKILGIPLVLHGGSGITDTDFKRAIDLGISKINFFTGMSQSALQAAKDFFRASLENYNDYLNMNLKIKDSVRKTVKEQMRIFGSINKANQ